MFIYQNHESSHKLRVDAFSCVTLIENGNNKLQNIFAQKYLIKSLPVHFFRPVEQRNWPFFQCVFSFEFLQFYVNFLLSPAGHRADMWVGTGIHMPANGPRKGSKHRQHRHRRQHKRPGVSEVDEEEDKKKLLGEDEKFAFFRFSVSTTFSWFFSAPGQRVQFLLSQDDDLQGGEGLETKRIFTEMVELHGTDPQQEWRQTAR